MNEPLGVIGQEGDSQVTLKWKPVLGAATYKLYMATETGVTKTNIVANGMTHDSTVNRDTHTGLTNDTTYYLVVTAVDSNSNESDISEQVSLTPGATATGN